MPYLGPGSGSAGYRRATNRIGDVTEVEESSGGVTHIPDSRYGCTHTLCYAFQNGPAQFVLPTIFGSCGKFSQIGIASGNEVPATNKNLKNTPYRTGTEMNHTVFHQS